MTAATAPTADLAMVKAVASSARDLLATVPGTPRYHSAQVAALALPDNILSETPDARWSRLVWTCCTTAGGAWEQAVPVAAAVEIFMVALDILDDEEDGEHTPLCAEFGTSRALNVSTGLLLAAQRGLSSVDGGRTALQILLDAGLRASAGQDADLRAASESPLEPQQALEITAYKSASLTAAACRLGAICSGADAPTQDLYACFGFYVGMVRQLANDIAAIHPDAMHKSDVALNRPTLPLAYAAALGHAAGTDTAVARTALWTGVPAYLTWAVAETYRSRGLQLIEKLAPDPTGRAELVALLPAL